MIRARSTYDFGDSRGDRIEDSHGEDARDGEGELIVSLLASGLLQAHQQVAYGAPLSLPYPAALQRGLDRLTLRAIRAGVSPPSGVPDLVRWCHEPLGSWHLPLGGEVLAGEVLMDLGVPTRACYEWAIDAQDVEREAFENDVVAEVRRICRAVGRQDSYVAFRHLVITTPVLTDLEYQQRLIEPGLDVLTTVLKRCYPAAPMECQQGGNVTCCADCRNLLVCSAEGLTCVDDRCPRTGRVRPGKVLPVVNGVRWLAAPVRAFISSPGRAELRLRQAILRLGGEVELWPNFDAYDLRIVFPDGEAWAVDVKDWSNPVRLARRLRRIPADPPWDLSFIVPAKDAVKGWPGYMTTLRSRSQGVRRSLGVTVASEQQLVSRVRARLKGASAHA